MKRSRRNGRFCLSDHSVELEFFKVFLPENSSHQISIPPAFTKHFEGSIPNEAILKDHTGKSWHVGLKETEKGLCFENGWEGFASYHSLEFGDFLLFKYNRKSLFEVKVFGKSGFKKEKAKCVCDIIPCINLEEDSETETETETTSTRPTRAGNRKHLEIGLKRNEKSVGSSEASQLKSRIAKINLGQGKVLKAKYPYFVVCMSKYTRFLVHIPKSVLNAFKVEMKPDMVLCDQSGKKWPTKVKFRNDGRIALVSGWSNFWEENDLQVSDQCVFEFVLGRGNISKEMRVQILRGYPKIQRSSRYWGRKQKQQQA